MISNRASTTVGRCGNSRPVTAGRVLMRDRNRWRKAVNPLGLHFTASQIIASLVFTVIGLYIFRRGKKLLNFPLIFISIIMLTYGFFSTGPWMDWGLGAGLCVLAYYYWDYHNSKTG